MKDFETLLFPFFAHLEMEAQTFAKENNELVRFWQDGFDRYISKMKAPKNIHSHPRRYFHLHTMMYLLNQCNSDIVWHLCPGNIKIISPVLDLFFENAQNKNHLTYWINIDIVPEIKSFNESILLKQYRGSTLEKLGSISYINYKNTKIFNVTGSLEVFFTFFSKIFKALRSTSHSLICLDGLTNVSISPPDWFNWWEIVKNTLSEHFIGWYFTWLDVSSLRKKFEFYYDIAVLKHRHPLNWVEVSTLKISDSEDSEINYSIKKFKFAKLHSNSILDFVDENKLSTNNFLFRFYIDQEKKSMIYQAFYIQEGDLRKIAHKQKLLFIGHKEVDKLVFKISEEFYINKDQNFVKSIPYVGIKDLLNKKE